jgi:DNA mismatch repair protein MutS
MTMIINEYIEYMRKYKEQYGEKCIVLLQVGSFYEMYTIYENNNVDNNDIYKVADICGILTTKKNKSIPEISLNNYVMAGFPIHSLNKFTQILLNNNYTIVIIQQEQQTADNKNRVRTVAEILSPGSNINITDKRSNYMMVIMYEIINGYIIAGISGIDLSTGKTFIYEVGSTKDDPELANDEVFRMISTYNPIELIILGDKIEEKDRRKILKNLNINNILVHYKWGECKYIEFFKSIINQTQILEKAFFMKKGLISIIEMLNMERLTISREGFCCLLQFAHEHNADIIKELQVPEIFENNNNMTIEFNSAVQLNILGLYQNDKPLIDVLNRCVTAFGSRYFKEKLLTPMINIKKINQSYDDIDKLLNKNSYIKVRKYLANISDLERFKRKLLLNKVAPQDWINFNESMEACIGIYNILKDYDDREGREDTIVSAVNTIINYYKDILDLENASKYNLADKNNWGNIFKEGVYDDIDNNVKGVKDAYRNIEIFCEEINRIGINDTTLCKIDYNDREQEYYIIITKKRYETALKTNKAIISRFNKNALSASSSNYKMTNSETERLSKNISKYNEEIAALVLNYYNEFVREFVEKNNSNIDILIKYLVRTDIAANNAKNAFDYRYKRPKISLDSTDTDTDADTKDKDEDVGYYEGERESSFINMKNMRHPLIERLQDELEYVGNDVKINKDGILLYGINASGKSSFMKAVGLNIIMAQSGMFVAAEKMVYYPYKRIFTRISGMDNIYKGMSSFTVEMTELRNILQRCNKYSLVIGDEICCGTESISGIAIVSAGIDMLINKGASFIFATHLHELTGMSCIKEHINDNKLFVKHIKIDIGKNNEIIYNRKIQDGQGSNMYGLEVCKSLDMPMDFLKKAEMFRKEFTKIDKDLIKNKKSNYNKKKKVDKCEICHGIAVETHHIKYQEDADENGFIGSSHKNATHNLASLCKECHIKEHKGIIKINGYKQSSKGIILDYDII